MFYSNLSISCVLDSLLTLAASISHTTCTSPEIRTKCPDKCYITSLFNHLSTGNTNVSFSPVSPDVNWTLMGNHPLAGKHNNRTIFIASALRRLDATIDPDHPATLNLRHVVGEGIEEWSVQELHGLDVGKNGLAYDNRFAWISRRSLDWKTIEMRSYLDSFLVNKAITENESGQARNSRELALYMVWVLNGKSSQQVHDYVNLLYMTLMFRQVELSRNLDA